MVAWTPKYNLPVEEPTDPSDMPTVTARQAASITAALDQVDSAAAARSAGRVSKSGDTINGGLTVTGRVAAGYDLMTGNYSWIHEFGKLWLIRDRRQRRRGAALMTTREPLLTKAAVVALAAALCAVAAAFAAPLTPDQTTALLGLVSALWPILAALWARGDVTPTADPRDGQGRTLTPTTTQEH